MRCKFEKFLRGNDVSIKELIVQMELFVDTSNFRPKAYVGLFFQNIAHLYLNDAVD